ncbi:uncharacterized protein SCHCODRAFT_02616991 [Schizophyllum commune H4-8]|uniref:uncharacterized protein n=1 Tax=Schizophyllum commune (strain H4-8 / FGSC 9210) TaxID=578458 RepID=UPI002160D502|nr:uncharacterized protein SCHCODRAFT_02616991 [Schizophyllum commune H4-8]KAI5897246.1 hypothetical protein SCHCODRAFT_02616991 [Schizophyllum commune H4-8]
MRGAFLAALTTLALEASAYHVRMQGRMRSPADAPLARRGNLAGSSPLTNSADISYYTNVTLGGDDYEVLIDTGSSDLWVAGSVNNAKDTGKKSGVTYAVGAVEGALARSSLILPPLTHPLKGLSRPPSSSSLASPSPIRRIVRVVPPNSPPPNRFTVEVTPDKENPKDKGLIGLGPNSGSNVYVELGSDKGMAVLDSIFTQNTSTPNYITVLLGRLDDPTDTFPGDLTVGSILDNYTNIEKQPKLEVTEVPVCESGDQHFQVLIDAGGIIGPDGKSSQVHTEVDETQNKKQPTGGGAGGRARVSTPPSPISSDDFSRSQVPRNVADAEYGRGAGYSDVSGVGARRRGSCAARSGAAGGVGGGGETGDGNARTREGGREKGEHEKGEWNTSRRRERRGGEGRQRADARGGARRVVGGGGGSREGGDNAREGAHFGASKEGRGKGRGRGQREGGETREEGRGGAEKEGRGERRKEGRGERRKGEGGKGRFSALLRFDRRVEKGEGERGARVQGEGNEDDAEPEKGAEGVSE